MPFKHRNQMAVEALDHSSMLLQPAAHELPSESEYHTGARAALQTQMRNRQLHSKTAERKARAM